MKTNVIIQNLDHFFNFEQAQIEPDHMIDHSQPTNPTTLHFQELFAVAAQENMKPLSGNIIKDHSHRSGLLQALSNGVYNLKGYTAITGTQVYRGAEFNILGGVIVDPKLQGLGLGKLLIGKTLESFLGDGTKSDKNLFARCNDVSKPLFEHFGFVFQETHADGRHVMTITA